MELFNYLSKYFWLVAIVVTCINWFMFRKRAEKYIEENYRTDSDNRTYFGFSAGGIFGAYALMGFRVAHSSYLPLILKSN